MAELQQYLEEIHEKVRLGCAARSDRAAQIRRSRRSDPLRPDSTGFAARRNRIGRRRSPRWAAPERRGPLRVLKSYGLHEFASEMLRSSCKV
eukprot:198682-Prorocentrum_minimum.AAC.1